MSIDLSGVLGGLLGGAGGPEVADNRVINTIGSPLQNVGEIMQLMNQGSLQNGGLPTTWTSPAGMGFTPLANSAGIYETAGVQTAGFGGKLTPIAIGLLVFAGIMFVARRRMGG